MRNSGEETRKCPEYSYNRTFLIILVVCFLMVGCFKQTEVDTLLSAPEKIEINGRKYILETYLWRDFQPICPSDGEPLCGIIWVVAVDSQPFPDSVYANCVWVINGHDVWETSPTELVIYNNKFEGCLHSGPKWGPNIYVDVVVRIIDSARNQEYLLRASNQYIQMICK